MSEKQPRQRILLVNCVYGNGSTGKILHDLHNGLINRGYDSLMCYARGKKRDEANVYKLMPEWVFKTQSALSKLTGNQYGMSPWSTRKLKCVIRSFNPDIVNLHCINANTVNVVEILNFLKRNNIKTVVTFHAEFLYTGGCAHAMDCEKWKSGCYGCPQVDGNRPKILQPLYIRNIGKYWEELKKAYTDFDSLRLTCVSPWVKSRASQSPFFKKEQIYVTPNGVDTSIFNPVDTNSLRERYKIRKDSKVYLHVTPNFLDSLKGGNYVVDFANMLQAYDPDARVIVVGYQDSNKSLPSNIIAVGRTFDLNELAALYSMSNATLLTSSRETFSMVTAESLCCGTSVAGFKAGGPESICTEGHAIFVDYGDVKALFKAATDIRKTSDISKAYSAIFSKANMVQNYIDVYNTFAFNIGE